MRKKKQTGERQELLNIFAPSSLSFEEANILTDIIIEKGYRKQSEWVSVDERLPEKSGKYLCFAQRQSGQGWFTVLDFIANPTKTNACFDDIEREGFYYFDSDWGDVETKEVTHWTPLPEAPKMRKEMI